MKQSTQRIGILTSGGDSPGMNAAIRAAFRRIKDISSKHEIVLFKEGLNGLAGRLEVNYLDNIDRSMIRGIIHRGGTFIGTGRIPELKPPPKDCKDIVQWERKRQEITDVAVVNLRQLGLDGVIVIGGDGSFKGMSNIVESYQKRYDQNIRLVGIAGTIDNDVWGTDLSIGFDTALNNIVWTMRNLRDTSESHRRCIILEVMGNNSGALALSAGIAGGATTVMVPENPSSYDIESILASVRAAVRLSYRSMIIVMAEGVKKLSENANIAEDIRQRIETDPEIKEILGRPLETRINIIGYIARGGQPSAVDNLIASRFGCAAADAVLDPNLVEPIMVGLNGSQIQHVKLSDVVEKSPRLMSPHDEIWVIADSLFVKENQSF
jgi:6-phosphofructokinase 1